MSQGHPSTDCVGDAARLRLQRSRLWPTPSTEQGPPRGTGWAGAAGGSQGHEQVPEGPSWAKILPSLPAPTPSCPCRRSDPPPQRCQRVLESPHFRLKVSPPTHLTVTPGRAPQGASPPTRWPSPPLPSRHPAAASCPPASLRQEGRLLTTRYRREQSNWNGKCSQRSPAHNLGAHSGGHLPCGTDTHTATRTDPHTHSHPDRHTHTATQQRTHSGP